MIGRWLVLVSIVVIGWFYLWTVRPEGRDSLVAKEDRSYFNLLARGLLKGQLALDVPADPILTTLDNPYDPLARAGHGLHDASYYRGKYYIYFGVTPVLLLYLPFHLVTGTFVTDGCAVMLFSLAGFLITCAILRAIVRRHFPGTPWFVILMCVWVLGLANMVPPLLRRPAMWEVPISCAYALFMLTLYCVYKTMDEKPSLRWAAAASLAMGLCVGARAVYLPGAMVLLAPLAWAGAKSMDRAFWRQAGWWKLAVATMLPIMAVGAGLALYNYQRFGNMLEFGQTYQMAGEDVSKLKFFSLHYIPFNLQIYLLSCPGLSPYFPFLTVISPPPVPPGQFGIENPYGLLPSMPWVLFAGATVWFACTRRGALGLWGAAALVGVILTAGMVFCFGGATGRYQVDFTPGLILTATVGLCWLMAVATAAWWRRAIGTLAMVLGVWSVGFNVLISLQHNRLLEESYPALYARIARGFNHVPHWIGRLAGWPEGPVELRLVFPRNMRDQIEPLVVTGHEFLSDYLFVHYLDDGLIRFGLEHTSRGTWTGSVTRIDPSAEHTLVVQMSSLFAPINHPVYDGMATDEIVSRTQSVKVLLDGRTVLKEIMPCYDGSDLQPSIGTSAGRPGFKKDFSGTILGWKRVAPTPLDPADFKTGKLHLLIRLPAFTRPKSEPLLSSGISGKGDLIYIRYLDATHYQIGHDRWGYGGSVGPVIEYDPAAPLDLDISCPPLLGEGAPDRLLVALNGHPLIDIVEPFHPSDPSQVVVGRNQIGASTAEIGFTGIIEIEERVRP